MQERKPGLISSIVRSAQLHPARTVEHCALILLVLHLASGRACHHLIGTSSQLCPARQRSCCCDRETPGPLEALTDAGVSPAPLPTMSLAGAAPGDVIAHHDFRGDIYRFPMGGGVVLNLMKTNAGTLRSGDLHNCTQFDVILQGRARLHTYDTVGRTETSVVYGRNDFIKIPARVPHLFEFLEDNYMVEWWDCDFRAWYFKPYRDRIARQFAASRPEAEKHAAAQAAESQPGAAERREGGGSSGGGSRGAAAAGDVQDGAGNGQGLAGRGKANTEGDGGQRSGNAAADSAGAAAAAEGGSHRDSNVRDPVAAATDISDGAADSGGNSGRGGGAGSGDAAIDGDTVVLPEAEGAGLQRDNPANSGALSRRQERAAGGAQAAGRGAGGAAASANGGGGSAQQQAQRLAAAAAVSQELQEAEGKVKDGSEEDYQDQAE